MVGLAADDPGLGGLGARTRSRRWQVAGAYLLVLVVLAATSPGVTEGDSPEYRAMANAISRSETPPPFVHFWLYPALAAPFLGVASALGVDAAAAFTIVNVAFLATACWLAAGLTKWPALALVFVSPIIWWVDKAHTEAFTFALLTIAFAMLATPRMNPGWALVALGLVAAQNPPALALLPVVIIIIVAKGRADLRDRRFVALCAAGIGLAALNPVYYFLRVGRAVPLLGYSHGGFPNVDELTAVLRDPNIGLLAHAPVLVVAFLFALGVLLTRAPRSLTSVDAASALAGGVALLFAFSQATNVNNGGTPGPSRYAMWFVPLGLPLLRLLDCAPVLAGVRRTIMGLSVASVAWSLWAFHPARPENFSGPTRFASWLWEHHPSLDRPLPEVFIERVRGGDVPWDLPVTTPQCDKILLVGRGPGNEMWPIPCRPFEVPEECRLERALCYANRTGPTYTFSRIPAPSYWAYTFNEYSVWTAAERIIVGELLDRWRWWEMRVCDGPESVVRGGVDTGTVRHHCTGDRVVIYVQTPGPSAAISVRLPARMHGSFIDAKSGVMLSEVRYDGESGQLWTIRIPTGHGSVVLALRAAS